jgi:hypothetical protein
MQYLPQIWALFKELQESRDSVTSRGRKGGLVEGVGQKYGSNVNLGERAQYFSWRALVPSQVKSVGRPRGSSSIPLHIGSSGAMNNNRFVILSESKGEPTGEVINLNFSELVGNPSEQEQPSVQIF